MPELLQDRLTQALVAACLLLGAVALLPQLVGRPLAVTLEQPVIKVAVEGLVVSPGTYQLQFGARVEDLVEAAGGLLPGAARALLSLAAPLTDGQVVQVPSVTTDGGTARVLVNSASADLLRSLPGIGPAMAQRILDHRPYSSIDDLLRVPGIGPRTLDRLRPLVGL